MQLEHPPFIMTKDNKALVMFIPNHKPTVINGKSLKRALTVRCSYHIMTTAGEFMRMVIKAVKTARNSSSRAVAAVAEATSAYASASTSVYVETEIPGTVRDFVASHYEMTKMAYEIRDRYVKECVPGTPDTYIKCCYWPDANGLPVGIYLYTKNRPYPDRVFFQTNIRSPTANPFMTVPVFPGSSPMSCVVVIHRSINGQKTYNAAFYTELVARGVLPNDGEDKQPPKFHKYEGVAVRSQSMCLIDRRWTAGDTICDVKQQLPNIHDTVSYMWPSTLSTPELEHNVLSVAMGILNRHMLFPQVMCSIGHRDNEVRYLYTAVLENIVDSAFNGFFVVAVTNAGVMKDVIGHRRGMVSFPEELFLVNNLPEKYKDPTNVSIFVDGTPTNYYIDDNDQDHFLKQAERGWPHAEMKEAHADSCVFVSCGGKSLYMYIGVFKRGTQNKMFFC